MKLLQLVLALLFGGRFIAACKGGSRRWARLEDTDPGERSADRQLYGDEDDEGW